MFVHLSLNPAISLSLISQKETVIFFFCKIYLPPLTFLIRGKDFPLIVSNVNVKVQSFINSFSPLDYSFLFPALLLPPTSLHIFSPFAP